MNDYQIQQVQEQQLQPQSAIIRGEDSQLHQVTRVSPGQPIQQASPQYSTQRVYRERLSQRRADNARAFSYAVFGVGAVFVGLVMLMMFGAIFASATKPVQPPAPVTNVNPGCWILCSRG